MFTMMAIQAGVYFLGKALQEYAKQKQAEKSLPAAKK